MAARSEVISIYLPDNSGKTVPFYTYDGYLEESDRARINHERRSFDQLKVSACGLFALVGFAATRRLTFLPVLSFKGISVPTAGLFSGAVAGFVGWDLFHFYGSTRLASIKRDLILNSKSIPLWSNLRSAVNPDRAFFELADEKQNQPLIFHSGLTPEAASKMIPDKVITSIERDLILNSKSIHFWANLPFGVNPDSRAFFELAYEKQNQPLIFHSGLTPESASKMIPDKVIGASPHKPHAPSAHHH